jgi:putative glutamine amidotransferase
MAETVGDHRHRTHRIEVTPGSALASAAGWTLMASCYHHQCLGRLGTGLEPVARAEDGVIEGVELPGRSAWFVGTQWHPEDTADTDPAQAALFAGFVAAAAEHSPAGLQSAG